MDADIDDALAFALLEEVEGRGTSAVESRGEEETKVDRDEPQETTATARNPFSIAREASSSSSGKSKVVSPPMLRVEDRARYEAGSSAAAARSEHRSIVAGELMRGGGRVGASSWQHSRGSALASRGGAGMRRLDEMMPLERSVARESVHRVIPCPEHCVPWRATSGFPRLDESKASEWILPVRQAFPEREYQRKIVKRCLFEDTMVVLPTGLGKTFIAAVVMYNFYRWYPEGLVVFMAPTRPLVAQQVSACHAVCGIPEEHLAQLQGTMRVNKRKEASAPWV